jgi:hypothetical protein
MAFKMSGFSAFTKKHDDDYKAFFHEHKEIGGDIVSGLSSEDDHFADLISAEYRANEQKEKGNSSGANKIWGNEAKEEKIKAYENKYKKSIDRKYLQKLSNQYIKSKNN